jgi:phosphoribosyl 1,2-cyclic phosphodiesterase
MSFHLYGLERTHDHFYAALEQSISKPLYPRSLEDMLVGFHFHEVLPGERVDVGNYLRVHTALANHPYRALGYRVESENGALAFIPDTAPFDRYLFDDDIVLKETSLTGFERERLVQRQDQIVILAGDSDWLIYDAALTPPEYEMLPHWGHSTMAQACDIAREAGAKELVLFHHGPTRTDDMVDAMLAEQVKLNPDMNISAAYAGMQLNRLREKKQP